MRAVHIQSFHRAKRLGDFFLEGRKDLFVNNTGIDELQPRLATKQINELRCREVPVAGVQFVEYGAEQRVVRFRVERDANVVGPPFGRRLCFCYFELIGIRFVNIRTDVLALVPTRRLPMCFSQYFERENFRIQSVWIRSR